MKSRVLKATIGISLFLILTAAVVAVIWPVYARITGAFHAFEEKYISLLEDNTGLGISYKSLSPSILTGINIQEAQVYDIESSETLLTIKKASVGYSLLAIIRGDLEHAFTKLNVSNVSFEYDGESYPAVNRKLQELMNREPEPQKEAVELTDEFFNHTKDMLFLLPFDVQVRNVNAHLRLPEVDAQAAIDQILIRKDKLGKSIQADLKGNAMVTLAALGGQTVGVDLGLNCRILDTLSESSFVVSLDEYSKCDYTVRKMEFLLRYADATLTLDSLQQKLPYELNLSYCLPTGDASVNVLTKDLNPFDLVKMPPLPESVRIVEGTTVSLSASGNMNVFSLDYDWNARGSLSLSRKILNSAQWVDFNARGNNSMIYLDSLGASGYVLGASGFGQFNLKTLEPSLTLSVEHARIPGGNGNPISGDVYLDSMGKAYTLFIPQLYLGEQNFTAIQAEVTLGDNAIDYSLSLSDYSHQEYDMSGEISLEGTFIMGRKNVVEVLVDVDNLFIDSILRAASYFLDEKVAGSLEGAMNFAEPFIMSTEIYLSTDLSSLSFNTPYTILANTRADKQMLVLSMDGNEQSIYVSQLDVLYDIISLQCSANVDLSLEDKQVVFSTDFNLNSIPYHLAGNVTDGRWINITGDYGFDFLMDIGNSFSGTLQFSAMPVAIGDFLFYTGLRSGFELELNQESLFSSPFKLSIYDLELEEGSDVLGFKPKISLMGSVDNSGLVIESLSYTDTTSSLDGSGYAMWNIIDDRFDNLNVNFSIKNPLSTENITIDGSITNTFASQELTLENILQYSVDLQVGINAFYMGRFLEFQVADDTFNATISATGTLQNPSIILNIRKFTLDLAGIPFNAKGNVYLEIIGDDEWDLDIAGLNASWSILNVNDINGSLELKSFMGRFTGGISADLFGSVTEMPFSIDVSNLGSAEDGLFPQNFLMAFNSSVSNKMLDHDIPIHAEIVRMPGMFVFNTDDYLKTNGYYMDNGTYAVNIDQSMAFHCNINGRLYGKFMDIFIKNLYCDLPEFAYLFNSPMFTLYNGRLNGDVSICGLQTDPDFTGYISLDGLDFNLPDYVSDHFTSRQIRLNLNQDKFEIPQSTVSIRDSSLILGASMDFNCFQMDNLHVYARTEGAKGLPFDVKIPLIGATGRLSLDADMTLDSNELVVTGNVSVNNTDVTILDMSHLGNQSISLSGEDETVSGSIKRDSGANQSRNADPMSIKMNVNLLIGQKVQFIVNPVLRGMLAQNTPLSFELDTDREYWAIKGKIALRGGEFSYLSRNFYIKEGSVSLNESSSGIDPVINLRAEAREHDDDGNPVTIILTVENQSVSEMRPRLYANPARTQEEILALLGQVATGDSKDIGSFLVAGVDYGVQVTVLRKIENSLRDLCNFDIFSIRSSVLQNAIKQGLNLNSDASRQSVSNYFDNSTVYIGKYFGDSLYFDAMLHWSYDDSLAGEYDAGRGLLFNAKSWVQGFVFQPEIGLEFESPFANIRWSTAPDWGNLQETLVPSTSITFSWRLNF